jgi:hypothetical protein
MFDDDPRIVGEEPIGHGGGKQRFHLTHHRVGRVGEDDVIWTAPSSRLSQKLRHGLGVNHDALAHRTVRYIAVQETQGLRVRFYARDKVRASAQGFNADGSRSRIEFQKAAVREPKTKN